MAHKLSEFILGMAFSALIFFLIYWYVPIVNNKGWALIAVLLGLVLTLLWLLRALERYHVVVIDTIYKSHEEIAAEYSRNRDKIELWTLFKGRYDALSSLLDLWTLPDGKGEPLTKQEIQYLEADFHNKLQDHFSPDVAVDWLPQDIPNSVYGQKERMRGHSVRLGRIINGERGHQKAIGDKANWQKQTIADGHLNEVVSRLPSQK